MLSTPDVRDLPQKFGGYFARAADLILTGRFYTIGIEPEEIGGFTTIEQDISMAGLRTTDTVIVTKASFETDISIVGARVSAVNVLSITWLNTSGGAATSSDATLDLLVIRKERE